MKGTIIIEPQLITDPRTFETILINYMFHEIDKDGGKFFRGYAHRSKTRVITQMLEDGLDTETIYRWTML